MQRTRSNRINIEAVIRMFILLGFALFFYVTIRSGKTYLYVHPRIVPYMKFGVGIMVIISLFVAKTIFSPQRRKVNVLPYMLFIIPLLSGFVLPARTMDSTSVSSSSFTLVKQTKSVKNASDTVASSNEQTQQTKSPSKNNISNSDTVNIGSESKDVSKTVNSSSKPTQQSKSTSKNNVQNSDTASSSAENNNANASNNNSVSDSSNASADTDPLNTGLNLKEDTVVVEDTNFAGWLNEIYGNIEKYEGKKIQITGFVLKDKDFTANELVVARFMMSCCTADLQPVGLMCDYAKAPELKHDVWIKVTGKIKKVQYKGQPNPTIVVEKVETAQKPKDEYVYP